MNKDTEIHPLVRWQYCGGLKDSERMGFLFENVTDVEGKRYSIPVAVGVMAGSTMIYALGMGCQPEELVDRWQSVRNHPIPPVMVKEGAVHDVVIKGKDLKKRRGFE